MADRPAFHEDLTRRHESAKTGTDRAFGLIFSGVFAVIAVVPLLSGRSVRAWSLAVAAAFLIVALAKPSLLRPIHKAWLRLGGVLQKITNPLVMALLFYGVVTPTALIMRLFGQDPLRLRFDPQAKSYWIERRPPGPDPQTMRHQF